jgi:DNA-directed RNA polymerase subunit RPC12/RpoP
VEKIKKNIALFFFILLIFNAGSVLVYAVFVKSHDPDNLTAGVVGFVTLGLLSLIPFYVYRLFREQVRECNLQVKNLQQANRSMEQQNLMDTKIGDYIICPYCAAPSDYVALKSPPPVEGLKHCLKCGRQFFTGGLNSYPVLFKK